MIASFVRTTFGRAAAPFRRTAAVRAFVAPCLALLVAASGTADLAAQADTEDAKAAPSTPADASAASYIIGPGDVFSLRLHGLEGSLKPGARVEPDGTISYLEARRVRVAGFTIPAARQRLESVLAESINDPRVIMTPVALGSKKYTILGMVNGNGTFPIDGRVTLLDAIARSGGINEGAVDFDRSFLSRNGQKVPVNLKALYAEGDLTQNLSLRNGDYLYVASVAKHEVYVIGAIRGAGGDLGALFGGTGSASVVPTGSKMTVMGAITAAGGYSSAAWRNKVLIIRGSLEKPETVVVETGEIIGGRALDVLVQPGDIIYVHTKPWAVATQLVDYALRQFVRASVSRALDVDSSIGVGN